VDPNLLWELAELRRTLFVQTLDHHGADVALIQNYFTDNGTDWQVIDRAAQTPDMAEELATYIVHRMAQRNFAQSPDPHKVAQEIIIEFEQGMRIQVQPDELIGTGEQSPVPKKKNFSGMINNIGVEDVDIGDEDTKPDLRKAKPQ
jgi:hypothetical protein